MLNNIVKYFNRLPYIFILSSCFTGHKMKNVSAVKGKQKQTRKYVINKILYM